MDTSTNIQCECWDQPKQAFGEAKVVTIHTVVTKVVYLDHHYAHDHFIATTE
ncbi:16527_t:CDS:2 [Rhizophagus irregularis]|nr:16527_t:CDS:2 [Rhizophagus irregularis]